MLNEDAAEYITPTWLNGREVDGMLPLDGSSVLNSGSTARLMLMLLLNVIFYSGYAIYTSWRTS